MGAAAVGPLNNHDPVRILFLTQWFDPEPGALRGLPLARWLTRAGHEVRVVTAFPNYPGGRLYPGYRLRWRQWERIDGIDILRVPLFPSHDRAALRRVLNYGSFALSATVIGGALAGKADVVYVYHPPATVGLPGLWLKTLYRIPMVYHIADMWPESVVESGMLGSGSLKRWVEATLGRWCSFVYRGSDVITVLSHGFKRLLVERGVPAAKIEVVYNWTDEEVFQPVPRDPALADSLGLAGRFNVLYAGNLGPFQALETVVRAAARVRHLPAIQIVIAGTGQRETDLRALAQRLSADNVRFLGVRPYRDMAAINSLADVLLVHLKDLPFFAATVPSKTQVALSSARPILMAVRGDAAEIVRRADAGLTCDPEDDAAMARAIECLYHMDPDARHRLGSNGRDFYLREMSLEVGGRRMAEIFAHVVGHGPHTGPARPDAGR